MRAALCAFLVLLLAAAEAGAAPKAPARHGAIAYHRASQAWGASYDFATAREARLDALRRCGHKRCEVVVGFRNGCGALAEGPKKAAAAAGVTRDEAEAKALRRCGAEACKVVAWACTR